MDEMKDETKVMFSDIEIDAINALRQRMNAGYAAVLKNRGHEVTPGWSEITNKDGAVIGLVRK